MVLANKPELELHSLELKKAATVLRAINHPLRQSMIKLINKEGSVIVTDIYTKLKVEQSIASQHLAVLRAAGFVVTERQGKFIYYKINHKRFKDVEVFMENILNHG